MRRQFSLSNGPSIAMTHRARPSAADTGELVTVPSLPEPGSGRLLPPRDSRLDRTSRATTRRSAILRSTEMGLLT